MSLSKENKINAIQLFILTILIIITALFLHPILESTEQRMKDLRNDLILGLENAIGYEISYKSVSPSIFSNISLNELVIHNSGNTDQVIAELESMKAFYSPFYFLGTRDYSTALQAIKRFEIKNSTFKIDLVNDLQLRKLFLSERANDFPLQIFPLKTKISGRNIELSINTDAGTILGEDLFFTLEPESNIYKTRLDGSFEFNVKNPDNRFQYFKSFFSGRGTITNGFESYNLTLNSNGMETNLFELSEQTVQLISSEKDIQIRKVQDNSPIDLSLRHNWLSRDTVLSFNSENFIPENLLTLNDSLEDFKPYLASTISGRGALMFQEGFLEPIYSFKGKVDVNRHIFDRFIVVEADFTGNSDQVNVRELDLRTVEGRLVFSGNVENKTFYPTGRIELINIHTPIDQTVNGSVEISHEEGFLYFNSRKFALGEQDISNLKVIAYPDRDQIAASLMANLNDGEIQMDTLVELGNINTFDAFVTLSDIDLEPISELIPYPPTLPMGMIPEDIIDSYISSSFHLAGKDSEYSVDIFDFQLQSNSKESNKLVLTASLDSAGLDINNMNLLWNDYQLHGYINSIFSEGETLITTHFDFEDYPYRIEGILNEDRLVIEGDYDLFGIATKTESGTFDFKVTSDSLPLPIEGITLFTDLNANGQFTGSNWSVFLDQSAIRTDSFTYLDSPEVLVTADVNSGGANFYSIKYRDSESSLTGLGRLTYSPRETSSWISLLDETGKTSEQYDLFVTMNNNQMESRLSVVSSPLERFKDLDLGGDVSVDIVFNGNFQNPEVQAVLETERMTLQGIPVSISSFIQGDKERIRISDLQLDYNGLMMNRGLVMMELEKGKLLATGAVDQIINNSRVSTSLTALVESEGSFDIYTIANWRDEDLTGKISIAPINWDGLRTFPQMDVILEKKEEFLEGFIDEGDTLYGSYNFDSGAITLKVKDQFPFEFDANGYIEEGIVDAQFDNLVFNPSFINYFMSTDAYQNKRNVVFTGGNVTGDIQLRGPITDPDYNGTIFLNEILFESPYLKEIPKPVSTFAVLDGHDILLEPFTIELEKGEIEVDSNFEIDEGLPTTFNVDVEISGSAGARIAYAIPGFSWDGHFTGYSHIEGNKNGGFLKGNLICNDLISSLESDAKSQPPSTNPKSPSVNGFTVDLEVQTGRDVNFFMPNRQVPIIQATAENGDLFYITYDSRSDVFALTGRVDIRTGEINYFNKTFYLQEGFIELNENQAKFNPRLNVRADVVSRDELGEDVTISLLFDDYLMNEFEPEFLSFPRKTENEILALLGQSFIPSNDPEQVSVASLLIATGGMIGKSTIMEPFEEAIKTSLNLDFVSFNTNIIENAILDRFQDQTLAEDDGQIMNFAKYLEDTSLFVGEYIGDNLFLEGSLVVDYDDTHSVSSPLRGLELNVNLNLQFITPFVLIDWTYNPKNNPNSDYFFPQNTITFTWQYSY